VERVKEVIEIIGDVLVLGDRIEKFDASTGLIGSLPEFDSVAVVTLITALEDEYGCVFDDDEISADNFENVGTLVGLLESKL
jgi:acyl carrier protein